MAKIKVKKYMDLAELIQWGWDNKIKNREFYSENDKKAIFNSNGNFKPKVYFKPEDTFTVEVEEEITEETVISRLLEVRNAVPSKKTEWKDLKIFKSYLYGNLSISEIKNEYSVAIYILNDDMTMTLIWREGEFVE